MGTKGHHHHPDHSSHQHPSSEHACQHQHHHHHHHHGQIDLPLGDTAASGAAVRRIKLAFYLNMSFAIIELVGGLMIGSFAIVADAIHDFGDSLSLALALVLQKKSRQGPTPFLTYGYQRYSILSSLLSGTIIIAGSFVIAVESITHLVNPEKLPNIPGMIGLSLLGILVNGLAAFGLSHGHSHNEKILSWHLIEDLLGWLAVLIGAICIKVFEVAWIDPLLAIGIALFVLVNVLRNLREPLRIIMQHAPDEQALSELQDELKRVQGVRGLDHVHAWSLDGRQHVFSATLRVASWDRAQEIKTEARQKVQSKGYHFISLELDSEPGKPD